MLGTPTSPEGTPLPIIFFIYLFGLKEPYSAVPAGAFAL